MALPEQLESQLAAALAKERAKVNADRAAASSAGGWSLIPGTLIPYSKGLWNDLVGGGTARDLGSSVHSGEALLKVHEERAAKVRVSGDLVELQRLLDDIGAEVALPSEVQKVARSLTFTGGVAAVAKDSARDLKQAAGAVFDFAKWLPWLLGTAAVFFLVVRTRRSS